MDRIEAWNHIIEELDAKTLEKADGLSVNELLEMIHKNYRDSYDNFVEEHKGDPYPYEDKWEDIQTVDTSLGEVYESDKAAFKRKDLMASYGIIADGIKHLLQKDLSNAHILMSMAENIEATDSGRVFFDINGMKFQLIVLEAAN